jgi:16S rRNA (guanine527-N7)-methyltransferase
MNPSAAWSCILSADPPPAVRGGDRPTDVGHLPPQASREAAVRVFGDRLPLAEAYAAMLADDGVRRGMIGPREVPRLWERHLLNCAVIADAFPLGSRVVDVGSGAGLPGLVLACVRADLRIDLIDSLQRRTRFLTEAVAVLDLASRVRVIWGRVEDRAVRDQVGGARWVTARAVAPLDRLASWCLPLLTGGGTLVAMKGAGAEDELAQAEPVLSRLGASTTRLVEYGVGVIDPPTRAVHIVRREPAAR